MAEEACLIVYWPGVGPDHPDPALPPALPGLRAQKQLASRRAISITFDSRSDFTTRVHSSLESSPLDAVVSDPLSLTTVVCLLHVEGMVCHSCVHTIETALSKMEGVQRVKVSLSGKEAFVQFDPSMKSSHDIVTSVDDMGFDTELISTYTAGELLSDLSESGGGGGVGRSVGGGGDVCVVIGVEGMVCHSCVSNIQTNVGKAKGVKSVAVSLNDKNARITYDPLLTSTEELCEAIEDLGFEATAASVTSDPNSQPGSHEATSCGRGSEGLSQPAGQVTALHEKGATSCGVRGRRRKCYVGIEGMTCHSCVSLIESAVGDLRGVVNVTVTLATKEGMVDYEEGVIGTTDIQTAIEDTGFEVTHIFGKDSDVYRCSSRYIVLTDSSLVYSLAHM